MDPSFRWNDGLPTPVIPGPLAEPGIHCVFHQNSGMKMEADKTCRGKRNVDSSFRWNDGLHAHFNSAKVTP